MILIPTRHSDPDKTVIYEMYVLLKHLMKQRTYKYALLIQAVENKILFMPAISCLYLLGLIEYNPENDSINYVGRSMNEHPNAENAEYIELLNEQYEYISSSLEEDEIRFDPEEVQRLFQEAGVVFPEQIKKNFQELIAFRKAITEERFFYLREELAEIKKKLAIARH